MTRLLRRLRGERGYSLVELLTVMAILSVVLGGLTTLFVQGSNAQLEMNRRFEAQQAARVALDKMRREVHCASSASTPSTGASPIVTLTLPAQCPTAVGNTTTSVSWCTVLVGTGRYALYRNVGTTCDTTGVKWADYLTPHVSVGDTHASELRIFQYAPSTSSSRARLRVVFPVKVGAKGRVYSLCDQLVFRNSTRTGSTTTTLTSCDPV